MKFKNIFFILLFGMLLINSCQKKDNETVPSQTKTDHPFSCLYENTFINRTYIEAIYWRDDKGLYIRAADTLAISGPQDISISLSNITGNTTRTINASNPAVYVDLGSGGEWYQGFSGTVTITRFDTAQKIVSGIFSCNMAKFRFGMDPGEIVPLGDTITIRSGQFKAPLILL